MDRGTGVSMDASQDGWGDWEVLPDHRSSSNVHDSMNLDGVADAHEPVDECKDIGVVLDETKPSKEESMPNVTDLMVSDGEEEEKPFQSTDDEKLVMQESAPCQVAEEEEEDIKKDNKARPECVVFSVGKLKVNGIGALCSFGVVAATVCIFLVGGKIQHHHRQQQQQQKIQFYGDDKRIQQVVQQTSRLNQAMSSVMGAGASARANISFGGFYDEF